VRGQYFGFWKTQDIGLPSYSNNLSTLLLLHAGGQQGRRNRGPVHILRGLRLHSLLLFLLLLWWRLGRRLLRPAAVERGKDLDGRAQPQVQRFDEKSFGKTAAAAVIVVVVVSGFGVLFWRG
jgi:hypothetical protein